MKLNKVIIPLMLSALVGCSSEPGDNAVAQVGDKVITEKTYKNYLKFKRVPEQDADRSGRLLDDYLEREAVAQQVLNSKYIDDGLAEIEVAEFKKQMLISRYFENFLNDKVSDEAVQNYYSTHPEEFQVEQAKAAHILIRTHDNMSEEERRARLTLAQEAYSKAKTDQSFEKIVEQYSEDTISAKQGGVIGWVKRGAIDQVFSEKLFAMQAGEISEPFATPFGFHVLKLIEAPQTIKTPFEKVKGDIRYRLRQQAKQAERDRLLSQVTIEKR